MQSNVIFRRNSIINYLRPKTYEMVYIREDHQLQDRRYILALLVLCLTCFLDSVHTECNVCSVSSSLACVSETEFRVCMNGAAIGDVSPCPNRTVCSLKGICEEPGETVIAPCAQCDQCDESNTFACKGPRQFALCLGTAQASDIVGDCLDSYVCDLSYPYICGETADGHNPSCAVTSEDPVTETPTTTTSTTPSPGGQPMAFCNFKQERGRFPVGTALNTTCRQYLLCMERNNAWIGGLYYCPNNLYYDDSTRACTSEIPARCRGRVGSLTLFDIDLF